MFFSEIYGHTLIKITVYRFHRARYSAWYLKKISGWPHRLL